MSTHIDFNQITKFIWKTVLSKRGIAICIAVACVLFAYNVVTARVIPMAYGSDGVGAQPTDLMAAALSIGTAIVSFIASNYLGVKPEVIQAVVAFEKDKSNKDNQRRLGAAVLGYLIGILSSHPDGASGFVMTLLQTVINNIEDKDTQDILKTAATSLAVNQFKTTALVGGKT